MQNPTTGQIEPYVEIWKSLIEITTSNSSSSLSSSTSCACCSSSSSSTNNTRTTKLNCCVWEIVPGTTQGHGDTNQNDDHEAMKGYEGRIISFGPWTQGVIWNKARSSADRTADGEPISVIRRFDVDKGKEKLESGIEIETIEFGLDTKLFPNDSQLGLTKGVGSCNVGDVVVSGKADGSDDVVRWKCVECWKSCDLKL
ncbi:unnamed protein product [Ambrosiozyma monospora]|uniref:Unnamed protein product n=1 Tax=Ambrosiozyma monospora TaxID=43982 RepID=A0ACB5T7G8_AMBMO|nr:unnamed protein product [Ambrosiozyma monospora]